MARTLKSPNPAHKPLMASEAPGLPRWIVWAPKGEHIIRCKFDGVCEENRVVVREAAVAKLNRSLDRRLEAGHPAFLDTMHDGVSVAAHVGEFRWDSILGILACVSWTPLGVECLKAVPTADVSPTYLFDRDTGDLDGINASGPVGGIVHETAFGASPTILANIDTALAGAIRAHLVRNGRSTDFANAVARLAELGVGPDAIANVIRDTT